MMTFAEHCAASNYFWHIASQIVDIFSKERGIADYDRFFEIYKKMPDFMIDSVDIVMPAPEFSTIAISCWMGDSQERTTIKIPTDFLDNFDEAKVTEFARNIATERFAEAERCQRQAEEKRNTEEHIQLAELLKKHGTKGLPFA